MEQLLRKDAATKQKEMDVLLFGKMSDIRLPYQEACMGRGLMVRVSASIKAIFS